MDVTINDRFKEIRKKLFKTQEEMAQALGVSQGTITDIERQRIGVSRKVAKKLFEELNVNQGWFYTGTGEMFTGKKQEIQGVDTGYYQGVSQKTNEFWNRFYQKQEPQKDEEWYKLFSEVEELCRRASFLYQRIVDVKILISNNLEIRVKQGIVENEAELMQNVFTDGAYGHVRAKYSDKSELASFREELNTLIQVFDTRFFELFDLLYRGLRKDLALADSLPKSVD